MNITKEQLSKNISVECNIPLEISREFVNNFFLIQKNILLTHNIKINKFGSMYKKITPSRPGRNPKTMDQYLIPEKLRIRFKASNKIKKLLN